MTSSPPQVCAPPLQVSEASATSATDNSKAQHLQQSSGEEDICRPLVDQVKVWEGIAAAEYGIDGSMDGWHSTQVQPGTSEDAYLQVLSSVLSYLGPYISVSWCTIISMSCRGGPKSQPCCERGGDWVGVGGSQQAACACTARWIKESVTFLCSACMCVCCLFLLQFLCILTYSYFLLVCCASFLLQHHYRCRHHDIRGCADVCDGRLP